MITHDQLLSILRYEPDTGNFIWVNPGYNQKSWVGKIAGSKKCCTGSRGKSVRIFLFRKSYLAHRLAWFYVHKEWPDGLIDHANGDPFDNRISNLRIATPRQNQFNKRTQKRNCLGVKGVRHSKTPGKFMSYIRIDGRQTCLGTFNSAELAKSAYDNAALIHHGKFARFS